MGMPIIRPGTGTRCEAITDIIETVALQQTALSHILNAEGEKIQKIVGLSTPEFMLETNKSVQDMVTAISKLELLLQSKLELFEDCLCEDCFECPIVDVNIFNNIATAIEIGENQYFINIEPSISTTIGTSPLSTITEVSLDTGFTLVGDQLIAPANLVPFQVYTNVLNIDPIGNDSPCSFDITIQMVFEP